MFGMLFLLTGNLLAAASPVIPRFPQNNSTVPTASSLKALMKRKQDSAEKPALPVQLPTPTRQPSLANKPIKQPEQTAPVKLPAKQQSVGQARAHTDEPSTILAEGGVGPDTFGKSVDEIGMQGNWMKKRAWVIRAFALSDQIQKLLGLIHQTRAQFSAKNDAIDDELDSFYRNVGVEQGKLEEVYGGIKRYLEKLRAKENEHLAESPRSYFSSLEEARDGINKQERQLSQLRFLMDSVTELDRSLEDRLKKADETIATAQHIAQGETELLDSLWYVIDDRKAQSIYFKIKNGVLAKVQAGHDYLTSKLLQDFEDVIVKIQEQMKAAIAVIDQLESAGVIVKDRTQRLEGIKQQALKEQAEAADREDVRKRSKQRQKEQDMVWYLQPFVIVYECLIQLGVWLYQGFDFFKKMLFS